MSSKWNLAMYGWRVGCLGGGSVRGGKAAAMLGLPMTAGSVKMAAGGVVAQSRSGTDSVLNGGSSANGGVSPSASATPDLFSFTFQIELKGQSVVVEVGASSPMSEVYEKAVLMLGEKMRKDALERTLYFPMTGIFLPPSRRADSFLLHPDIGDMIDLELKKKDKKSTPIVVLMEGSKTETVEINPNTSVLGVIQLLPRKNLDDDYLCLYNKKGKIDWVTKVASVIKKEEALECEVDADLKSLQALQSASSSPLAPNGTPISISSIFSANKDKKKLNRKSIVPSKSSSGLTPSSSSSSLNVASLPPASSKEKDKKNLERFLGNRPSEADLKKKNIIVDFNPDAKTAAAPTVDANSALPLQLSLFQLLGAFLKNHLDLVGLFRVSGDVEDTKAMYTSLWTPNTVNWKAAAHDPHIVSSTLKLYLRKQTDPLIPFSLYSDFMAAQKIDHDDDAQLDAIRSAIAKLPQPNASILHYLIHLLTLVAAREPVNKMNPINIGIVFGPTIMWDPNPNVMDYSSTGYQSNLVTNMIDHYNLLWTTQPPADPQDVSEGQSQGAGGSNQGAPSGSSQGATSLGGNPSQGGNSRSSQGALSPPPSFTPPLTPSSSGSSINVSPYPASPSTSSKFPSTPDLPSVDVTESKNGDTNFGARSTSSLRPSPPASMGLPPSLPPGGPPKKMPPKLPSNPPPSVLGGGAAPGANPSTANNGQFPTLAAGVSVTPSDLLQTRNSFRKSLPPGSLTPPPSTGGYSLSPVPETGASNDLALPLEAVGTMSPVGSQSPNYNASRRPTPPSRRPSSLSSALSKFDTQLMAAEQEIKDATIPPGNFTTISNLNLEDLRNYFLSQPSHEATKYLISILGALASKQGQ